MVSVLLANHCFAMLLSHHECIIVALVLGQHRRIRWSEQNLAGNLSEDRPTILLEPAASALDNHGLRSCFSNFPDDSTSNHNQQQAHVWE